MSPPRRAGFVPDLREAFQHADAPLETPALFRRLADKATVRGSELKQLQVAFAVDFNTTFNALANVKQETAIKRHAVVNQLNAAMHDIAVRMDRAADVPTVNTFGPFSSNNTMGLTHFTGTPGANFNYWIRGFNDYANTSATPLTDEKKTNLLLAFLKNDARDKAEDIADTVNPATFDEWVTALKQALTDPHRQELSRQQLRSCSQAPTESVDEIASKRRRSMAPMTTKEPEGEDLERAPSL